MQQKKTLVNHIREKLPGLKRKIEELTAETQSKYASFGGMIGEEFKNKVGKTSSKKKQKTKTKTKTKTHHRLQLS